MENKFNFAELETRLDRIQDFILSILKEKNPQGYAEFLNEINLAQEKN